MATDQEIEKVVEDLGEMIDEIAGDSKRFSQQESIDLYRSLIIHCQDWIKVIEDDVVGELEE